MLTYNFSISRFAFGMFSLYWYANEWPMLCVHSIGKLCIYFSLFNELTLNFGTALFYDLAGIGVHRGVVILNIRPDTGFSWRTPDIFVYKSRSSFSGWTA